MQPFTTFPYSIFFLCAVALYATKMLLNTFRGMLMLFMISEPFRCNPQRIHNTELYVPVSCCFQSGSMFIACLASEEPPDRKIQQLSEHFPFHAIQRFYVFACGRLQFNDMKGCRENIWKLEFKSQVIQPQPNIFFKETLTYNRNTRKT